MTSSARRAQLGLLAAFVVLTASVAALVLVPRYSRPVAAADIGTVAPDFKLRDTNNAVVRLSDFRGQAVVLLFSSLDCPAQYNDRIDRFARDYETDGRVKFLALNAGQDEQLDPVLLKLDDRVARRSYPTLIDPHGTVAGRYSAGPAPFMVAIDPHGVVRYRGPFDNRPDITFVSHGPLADALREILDQSTVAVASK